MPKIYLILTAVWLAWIPLAMGQTSVAKIEINSPVPEIQTTQLINYPKKKLSLASMKGKAVILDFWHTRCASCVHAFPQLQQIQNRYATQLQILLVGYEDQVTIHKFLKLHQKLTGLQVSLPIIYEDKKFSGYFQPTSFPHYVWIDSGGIVRHITFGDVVTEENIQKFLENKNLDISEKKADILTYDTDKPFFINGNGGDGSQIICYSVISKFKESLGSTSGYFNPGGKNSSIHASALPIKELFQSAFNDFLNYYYLPNNRTILQVRDTSKYVWNIKGVLQWNNLYNYQLIAPNRHADSLKKLMQQDLMRYFGLEAHLEKKILTCWVMRAEDTSLLISRGGKMVNNFYDQQYSVVIRNVPDSLLPVRFAYGIFSQSPYPFVCDIHMTSHIDILLEDINFNDASIVIDRLKSKYKINIQLEPRLIDVLFITEPSYQKMVNAYKVLSYIAIR